MRMRNYPTTHHTPRKTHRLHPRLSAPQVAVYNIVGITAEVVPFFLACAAYASTCMIEYCI